MLNDQALLLDAPKTAEEARLEAALSHSLLPESFPAPHVAGMGCDLVAIDRIQAAFENHGDRFVTRLLGPDEQALFAERYAQHPERGVRFLATRFAVKEAFSKAIGLGLHEPMSWPLVQTLQQPSGQPYITLQSPLKDWYHKRFGAHHVSLTDEQEHAMAVVIIEPCV